MAKAQSIVEPPQSGINYSPFRSGQFPWTITASSPSAAQISEDLNLLQQKFTTLRIYRMVYPITTGGSRYLGREIVDLAARRGLYIVIQVWIDRLMTSTEITAEIQEAANVANQYSNVVGILIGSEVLFRGDRTAADIASYIDQVRLALGTRRFSIPITYADTYTIWAQGNSINPIVNPIINRLDWIGLDSETGWPHSEESSRCSPALPNP
jgi:exo-beta-1,3-glucanase (GH17 family)